MRVIAGSVIILLVGLLLTTTGCTSAETGLGTIDVLVTSDIVEEDASDSEAEIKISNIRATVSKIKVYRGGVVKEEEGGQGKWVNLYVASKPLNLLKDSSQEQFLAFANVAATSYDELVMVIDELCVTLSNGSKITITPDEPFDFIASFVVYAGKTTTVVFKFNIDTSVTFTDEGKAAIKPLAGITLNVRYEGME